MPRRHLRSSARPRLERAALIAATLSVLAPAAAQAQKADAQPAPAGEEGKRIDPLGRCDALTLLVYPDTPCPKPTKVLEAMREAFGETAAVPVAPQELTREELLEQLPYPWQLPLWEAAGEVFAGAVDPIAGAWSPQWYFFPAEEGATLAWLAIPLEEVPPPDRRIVAMLRAEGEDGQARTFGGDDFPFEVRETSAGPLALAARSVEPGRYALVAGLATEEGELDLKFAERQIVARVATDQLRLSRAIVADVLTPLSDPSETGPFRVSGFEVVPRPDARLRRGEELKLFYQVLGAAQDESGRVDIDVSYQLSLKHPRTGQWQKVGQPNVETHQTGSVRAWVLPIAPQYPLTDYKIEISVTDNRGGGTVTQTVPFAVVE